LDTTFLNITNLKFVLDRGFYSKENIAQLHQNGYKFLVGIKRYIKYVSTKINDLMSNIQSNKYYYQKHGVYCATTTTFIHIKCNDNDKKSTKSKFKLYIDIYYDPIRAVNDKKDFLKRIYTAFDNLKNGKATDKEKKFDT
jgi:transposase